MKSNMFKLDYGFYGQDYQQDYRVTTISTSYLNVSEIIMQRLKSIVQL